MAVSQDQSERRVAFAVDESEHSEHAFQCEY